MKLSTIISNYGEFINSYKKLGYSYETINIRNKRHIEKLLNEVVDDIILYNEFLDVYDYTEKEKKQIISWLNNLGRKRVTFIQKLVEINIDNYYEDQSILDGSDYDDMQLFESTKDLAKLQTTSDLNLYSHNVDSDLEDEFHAKSSNAQFTIKRSFNDLLKYFGKPIKDKDIDWSSNQWYIYFKEYDILVQIYDWDNESKGVNKNTKIDWYVAFNEKDSKYADDIKKLLDRYYNPSSNGKLFESEKILFKDKLDNKIYFDSKDSIFVNDWHALVKVNDFYFEIGHSSTDEENYIMIVDTKEKYIFSSIDDDFNDGSDKMESFMFIFNNFEDICESLFKNLPKDILHKLQN